MQGRMKKNRGAALLAALLLSCFGSADSLRAEDRLASAGLDVPQDSALAMPASQLAAADGQVQWNYSPVRMRRWFAGAEYLLIRTHFSEAIAYASVKDSAPGGVFHRDVSSRELKFDYRSSFRVFAGYNLNEWSKVRFTFWHLDTSTSPSATVGPGETIIDPYGGAAKPGMNIQTSASVRLNVYDIEYVRPMYFRGPNMSLSYSAGLRFADVDEASHSNIYAGQTLASAGLWTASFTGVGPYLSLTGDISPWRNRRFSFFAKGGAAVLVGRYRVGSGLTAPGVFAGTQTSRRTLTVPMMQARIGARWRPTDQLTFSTGWLFQSWWDLGASGGTFDASSTAPPKLTPPMNHAFVGTDDSNILSFDGWFLRGQYTF